MNQKIKTITICSSVSFSKQFLRVRDVLVAQGYKVLIPFTAEVMEKEGSFNVKKHKPWYDDPSKFSELKTKMNIHLRKVKQADVILVTNYTKRGIQGYIGGSVLIEMFYAWQNKKKIYVLNPPSKKSPLYEEIMVFKPTILNNDLSQIA